MIASAKARVANLLTVFTNSTATEMEIALRCQSETLIEQFKHSWTSTYSTEKKLAPNSGLD